MLGRALDVFYALESYCFGRLAYIFTTCTWLFTSLCALRFWSGDRFGLAASFLARCSTFRLCACFSCGVIDFPFQMRDVFFQKSGRFQFPLAVLIGIQRALIGLCVDVCHPLAVPQRHILGLRFLAILVDKLLTTLSLTLLKRVVYVGLSYRIACVACGIQQVLNLCLAILAAAATDDAHFFRRTTDFVDTRAALAHEARNT